MFALHTPRRFHLQDTFLYQGVFWTFETPSMGSNMDLSSSIQQLGQCEFGSHSCDIGMIHRKHLRSMANSQCGELSHSWNCCCLLPKLLSCLNHIAKVEIHSYIGRSAWLAFVNWILNSLQKIWFTLLLLSIQVRKCLFIPLSLKSPYPQCTHHQLSHLHYSEPYQQQILAKYQLLILQHAFQAMLLIMRVRWDSSPYYSLFSAWKHEGFQLIIIHSKLRTYLLPLRFLSECLEITNSGATHPLQLARSNSHSKYVNQWQLLSQAHRQTRLLQFPN